MKKKWLWAGAGVVVLVALVYLFLVKSPSSFPNEKVVVAGINNAFPEAKASEVQGVIEVSETKRFVPFRTEQNLYGKSLWVWNGAEWKAENIRVDQEPELWEVERGKSSTYHFIWNVDPDTTIETFEFYLLRDRNYRVSDGVKTYMPGVQMKKVVDLTDQSYGVLKMPEEWSYFMDSLENTMPNRNPLFSSVFSSPTVEFRMRRLNAEGESVRLSLPGGIGYGGSEYLQFIPGVDERGLEKPVE
ncbi:hypothetical protein LCM20_17570 [Halobacillus litoralis]|uniref:hypothetical protein n=1 Tax=Halobacillus litoralis TaxID=45668 RepID=UPI001CD22921|nr:hypothetical protein [Halobacillus litoralis]MCA0972407.1 hypothetical protein [Halobacillus litoralis]